VLQAQEIISADAARLISLTLLYIPMSKTSIQVSSHKEAWPKEKLQKMRKKILERFSTKIFRIIETN
jgi:hypothetical protein